MKKILLIIIINIICQIELFSQTNLYNDNQGVIINYQLTNTGNKTNCYVDYDKNYTNKSIHIWILKATIINKSKFDIRPKLNNTLTMNVGVPNGTSSYNYCQYKALNNYHVIDGQGDQSKPFFGIKDRGVLKPGESNSNTTFLYLYENEIPKVLDWNFPGYTKQLSKTKQKKEDDFWSGKKEQKTNQSSTNNDDFWSGGKDKTANNGVENDFWKGKGNKQEEKTFEENTKPEDSDKYIGNVRSRTKRIRIFCRDTGAEDGDLVSVSNNGKVLNSEIYLTNAGNSYWYNLGFGQNRIEIKALNQGTSGANTAAFIIYDDNGSEIAKKGWHLKTGYKGTLLILKI